MIDTARIRTGFDMELQLGAGWFLTAVSALHDNGLLVPDPLPPPAPPDAEVVVTGVEIIFEPGFDLRIDLTVAGFPLAVRAALTLDDDGTQLQVTTDMEDVEFSVPFQAFENLAGPPVLQKVAGEGDNAPAIALLANLNIRASAQSGEPLPAGEHVQRGNPDLAASFLPAGQDMVLGVGEATFPRLANNIWHTRLRAADGSHPLPDADDPKGEWAVVTMTPLNGGVRLQLEGDIPVDSPLIDLIPDPHVTVTLDLSPVLSGGDLTFEIEVDANVDTGLLGDLFAFFVGGFIGFLLGLVLGGLVGALFLSGVFGVASVIALEVGEAIVEGKVTRQIRATLDGKEIAPILTCREGVVHEAAALPDEGTFSLGPLDAIPRSIPIFTDELDPLVRRTLVVTANYDELQVDGSGLAIAGRATGQERFQPRAAELAGRVYDGDQLVSLRYQLDDGNSVDIPFQDALQRTQDAELQAPFKVQPEPGQADFRIPEGRLPTVCLRADAIRRKNTVVTEIRFTSGVDLRVPDAIRLQDAGALLVQSLQLIHPSNASPYYRSFPDSSIENNFENLPRF